MANKFWTSAHNVGFGCRKSSFGCKRCWAELTCARMANAPASRDLIRDAIQEGVWSGRIVYHPERARRRWPMTGSRRMEVVAVNWLSDVGLWTEIMFHQLLDGAVAMQTERKEKGKPLHQLLLLSKHPLSVADKLRSYVQRTGPVAVLLNTLWVGVTICHSSEIGKWGQLLATPPGFKLWACCEPLLSNVTPPSESWVRLLQRSVMRLRWVVTGAETGAGPGARPFPLDAAADLARWCQRNDAPLLVKDNGHGGHELDGGTYDATPWGLLTADDWPRPGGAP